MRGQVKIKQKKLAARRRRRAFLLTLYSVAAAGLFFCALSYISGLDGLSIRGIRVSGNSRLASSTVEAIALRDMAGNYGGFFFKGDSLLYPKAEIEKDLLALPLVKDVRISRADLHTLAIGVVERSKVARWCAGDPGDVTNCYSLDENSLAFAKEACAIGFCAPAAGSPAARATQAAAVFLGTGVVVDAPPAASGSSAGQPGDKTGLIYRGLIQGDPIGQRLLDPAEFRKVSFFIGELAGLSVDPREAVLSGTSTAPYMTVILGGGGKLVINAADDLSLVLGNISAVISDKTVVPSLSKFLSELDYMKLDIGNKVVYKLKNR